MCKITQSSPRATRVLLAHCIGTRSLRLSAVHQAGVREEESCDTLRQTWIMNGSPFVRRLNPHQRKSAAAVWSLTAGIELEKGSRMRGNPQGFRRAKRARARRRGIERVPSKETVNAQTSLEY
jgi:hypothetical protein